MSESFPQLLQSDPLQAILLGALMFVAYVVVGLLPICGACYLIYFLLTLPLRRNERARLFLDLLELGIDEGLTPEEAITRAAASRDRSLGARFHLLAAHIEQGLNLTQALEKGPRLLPPQVSAILKVGGRVGDMKKVIPAGRLPLRDGVSYVRGAHNYLILVAFAVSPAVVTVPLLLKTYVLPKFREVFVSMLGDQALPALTRVVFGRNTLIMTTMTAVLAVVWLAALVYVGGPRLQSWIHRLFPATQDWLLTLLPWRRKRLHRDCSAMLAVLLDAQVPETEAVTLAAKSTGNLCMMRRAQDVCARLRQGVKLPVAVAGLDRSPEFQWRLSNALQRGAGFVRALSGWQEALDARAFQLHQTAAQITTSVLVLINGAIVASIMIAVFLVLVQLINGSCVW